MNLNFLVRLIFCAGLITLSGCNKDEGATKSTVGDVVDTQKLFDSGQFQSARTAIEAAIKANPRNADAHLLAGQIDEKLEDFQAALQEYVTADAMAPGTEKARTAAASLLLRLKAYQPAQEWIARCLAERPGDRAMKAYRALLEQRLGDTQKARADAEAIIAENKGNVIANAVLAEQALRRNDPDHALITIDAGLSTAPTDETLLQLKAQAYLQQQHPEKAADFYRVLVAAAPRAAEYRVALAELLTKTSSPADAEQVLRDGITVEPKSVDMHAALVSFLAKYRGSAAAIDELRSLVASTPESIAYDLMLAERYAQAGNFDSSVAVLRTAISRSSTDRDKNTAQLALARVLMANNKVADAREIVDSALKSNPADDAALFTHGQLMVRDRKPEDAIKDFLSIVGRQPANAAAYAALADAYMQNGQRQEAVAAFRRVLNLRPSDFDALRRLVDVQVSFAEPADAARAVDSFIEKNPTAADAQALRIRLAIQSKDWATAETSLVNLRGDPEAAQLAVRLDAELKDALGQYAGATDLYGRLISQPGKAFDLAAASAYARACVAAGKGPQCVTALEGKAASVSTAEMPAYQLILSSLYDNLGQVNKSRDLIESAIEKAPTGPAPYLQQAVVLARGNDPKAALAMIDRGIAAGAPKEPLLLTRANILNSSGRSDEAIATYQDVLKINPGSVIAANELANTLADRTPVDAQALRSARDLLQKNAPVKTPEMLDTLAWANFRLGDPAKARQLLDLANAGQSTKPQLRFHYGAVLIALGERPKGQQIIRQTLNENYPGRDEAEKLLQN